MSYRSFSNLPRMAPWWSWSPDHVDALMQRILWQAKSLWIWAIVRSKSGTPRLRKVETVWQSRVQVSCSRDLHTEPSHVIFLPLLMNNKRTSSHAKSACKKTPQGTSNSIWWETRFLTIEKLKLKVYTTTCSPALLPESLWDTTT